jgi:hypothetical protein
MFPWKVTLDRFDCIYFVDTVFMLCQFIFFFCLLDLQRRVKEYEQKKKLYTVDACEERTIFAETTVPETFEDCAGVKIKVPG